MLLRRNNFMQPSNIHSTEEVNVQRSAFLVGLRSYVESGPAKSTV